jgi:hypothetical protein
MYSARIDGRNTAVTVAMYLGDGAEEVQCYILFSQYGVSLISGGVAPGYCEVYVGSASSTQNLLHLKTKMESQSSKYYPDLWSSKFRWYPCHTFP